MRDKLERDHTPSDPMEIVYNVTTEQFTYRPHFELVEDGHLGISAWYFYYLIIELTSMIAEDIKAVPVPRFKMKIKFNVKFEAVFSLDHINPFDASYSDRIKLPFEVWYRRNVFGLHKDLYICR